MSLSFKSLLGNMFKPETLVDPASFNDPVATQTSWEPVKSGGTNFRTHKLEQTGPNRMEFRPTTMMKVFPWLFAIIPLIVLGAVVANIVSENGALVYDTGLLVIGLVALGFGAVTYFLIRWARKAIIFDKSYGYYWKGKRDEPGQMLNPAEQKESVRLSEVHALQIIHEWVTSSSGKSNTRYRSYELNLVLKSGDRVNVVDHGNVEKLREDAKALAQFLHVPVWDGTQG